MGVWHNFFSVWNYCTLFINLGVCLFDGASTTISLSAIPNRAGYLHMPNVQLFKSVDNNQTGSSHLLIVNILCFRSCPPPPPSPLFVRVSFACFIIRKLKKYYFQILLMYKSNLQNLRMYNNYCLKLSKSLQLREVSVSIVRFHVELVSPSSPQNECHRWKVAASGNRNNLE